MKGEDLLVLDLWLLEVDVVALWMGGVKDHFPRDQPAYVSAHCSFVGSDPRLNEEFEVAGFDHAVWTEFYQLSVQVEASAEHHAFAHFQGHVTETALRGFFRGGSLFRGTVCNLAGVCSL